MAGGRRTLLILAVTTVSLANAPLTALAQEGPAKAAQDADHPSEDQPVDRITLVRLGGTIPLGGLDGIPIPVWVLGHYSRDLAETGLSVAAWIKTSRLEATVDGEVLGDLRLGFEGRGELLSADDAPFRYVEGRRTDERAFGASYGGGWIFARYESEAGLRAGLRYGLRRFWYSDGLDTADTFRLPTDQTTQSVRADVGLQRVTTYDRRDIKEGVAADAFLEFEERDTWTSWGDTPATRRDFSSARNYWRYGGHLGAYLRFLRHHNLTLDLTAKSGEDLDYLSAYTLGSQISYHRVVGYWYAEFRARHLVVSNLEYGANLWGGARGNLIFDAAWFGDQGRWDHALGVGVRLRQKIWLGIPVVVQYGYGIDADRPGPRGGHELYLAITAAF